MEVESKRMCQKSSLTFVSRGRRERTEHGVTELIKDVAKLGCNEITLKCDKEPTPETAVRANDLGELASSR